MDDSRIGHHGHDFMACGKQPSYSCDPLDQQNTVLRNDYCRVWLGDMAHGGHPQDVSHHGYFALHPIFCGEWCDDGEHFHHLYDGVDSHNILHYRRNLRRNVARWL